LRGWHVLKQQCVPKKCTKTCSGLDNSFPYPHILLLYIPFQYYLLDGLGVESLWGRDFLHLSRLALGPTRPHMQWVPLLSRG